MNFLGPIVYGALASLNAYVALHPGQIAWLAYVNATMAGAMTALCLMAIVRYAKETP